MRSRRVVALSMVCAALLTGGTASGCGRIRFQRISSNTDATLLDGSIREDGPRRDGLLTDARLRDASLPGCPFWDGPWTLEEPENVEGVNTELYEDEPALAPDGLTLYFGGGRSEDRDGFIATRSSADAPFGSVRRNPFSIDDDYDSGFMLTADETAMYFEHGVDDGSVDIWIAFPTNPKESPRVIAELNASVPHFDPWSLDGLHLYFAEQTEDNSNSIILIARRDSTDDTFEAPEEIPGIDSEYWNDNPSLSPDERFIVFASIRPGGLGDFDLWYATRPDTSSPFGPAQHMPVVNSASSDSEVFLSPYNCELYFSSTRSGGMGGQDIYRTRFISAE